MPDFGYCEAWPEELKELSRRQYRACQRVRNLEAYITRVDPEEFDTVMAELENARSVAISTGIEFARRNWLWAARTNNAG